MLKKNKFVVYGTRNMVKHASNVYLQMGGQAIFCEPSYNYLGITLDSNLTFKKHVDQCAKIVSHKIYILSKIRRSISEDTAVFIYRSMIAPILEYGDVIYAGGLNEGLDKLQKLQSRALGVCLDVHHYLPVILLHQETNIPKLNVSRSCNIKKYMYKQQLKECLVVEPRIQTRVHKGTIFKTLKPNLEKIKKNPLYQGALTWNELPAVVCNIETYDGFKSYLNDWAKNVNDNA